MAGEEIRKAAGEYTMIELRRICSEHGIETDRWATREAEWGKKLLFRTGQLSLAREWTKTLSDTKTVFDKLRIEYEIVKHADLVRRFPQMTMDGIEFGMFVPGTGVLKAREGCVAVAHAFERKARRRWSRACPFSQERR